jgi:hypothetical protein
MSIVWVESSRGGKHYTVRVVAPKCWNVWFVGVGEVGRAV